MKTFKEFVNEKKGKDTSTKDIKNMIYKIDPELEEETVRQITKEVYSHITQLPNISFNKKLVLSFMNKKK